ncbi:MAG: hypothetical protein WC712_05830 [Candidatus Brocadiia bacterium]
MQGFERLAATLCFGWAVIFLLVQYMAARGAAVKDYSTPAGSPLRGMIYAFTTGMLPAHKETVRKHPVKFLIGVTMHGGALFSILVALLLIAFPGMGSIYPPVTIPFLAVCAACGVYLFIRRVFSANLRAMSNFDDYFAAVATAGFIAAAALHEYGTIGTPAFLLISSGLFLYLPLGKLRHALFFFVARADYGRRLGYRGVYPADNRGA